MNKTPGFFRGNRAAPHKPGCRCPVCRKRPRTQVVISLSLSGTDAAKLRELAKGKSLHLEAKRILRQYLECLD